MLSRNAIVEKAKRLPKPLRTNASEINLPTPKRFASLPIEYSLPKRR